MEKSPGLKPDWFAANDLFSIANWKILSKQVAPEVFEKLEAVIQVVSLLDTFCYPFFELT